MVLTPRRWRQVSRKQFHEATVAKEPGHRGEHEVTVKTIAQGELGVSGEPVVTMLVCFFISHARLRVQRAPSFPCALVFSWANGFQNSGAQRRGKVDLCLLSNRCLWLTRGSRGNNGRCRLIVA